MKKYFKYIVIMLVLVVPIVSFAAEFRVGDQTSVGKNERVTDDLYIAGGSVTSAGNVAGDLITAGGNIVISGNVGSDLMVVGGNVNILSDIGDDVRVGGGTVVVQGKIGGDLLVGGGQVTVGGAGVAGDVAVGAGNVRIDAPVAGKLHIAGGNVFINAPISGDVTIEAEKVTLGSLAVISGDVNYKSSKELVQEDGAVVKGKINFEQVVRKNVSRAAFATFFSAVLLIKFLALLVCSLLIGLTFRRYSKEITSFGMNRTFFELGRGLVVSIVMPIASILLMVTVIGMPLGIIGLLSFAIVFLFTWIMAPVFLGSVLWQYFSKRETEVTWKTILLGAFVFSLLSLIPILGWLVQTFLILVTLGSVFSLKMKIIKEWR